MFERTKVPSIEVVTYFPQSPTPGSCLVHFVFEGEEKDITSETREYLEARNFKGATGSAESTASSLDKAIVERLYVGLGKRGEFTPEAARVAAAKAVVTSKATEFFFAQFEISEDRLEETLEAMMEGALLAAYKYENQKGKKYEKKPERKFSFVTLALGEAEMKKIAARASKTVEAVYLVRDLGNMSPNMLTPEKFLKIAEEVAAGLGFESRRYYYEALQEMGAGALCAVGQGSVNKPTLFHATYRHPNATKKIALVGKGVTFDTGGISLKPSESMDKMRFDMLGAATVIAQMILVAESQPKVDIDFIAPMAENSPGGNAYKPGDVITTMVGDTIDVGNTDAEGRLILADAFAYVEKYLPEVDTVIDLATLTGAIVVSLGHNYVGLFSDSDELTGALLEAAKVTEEGLWRMPLDMELLETLDSKYADTSNISKLGRPGGAITAALFLWKHKPKNAKLAHLDIAGAATGSKKSYCQAAYPTGIMVRTLDRYLRNLVK